MKNYFSSKYIKIDLRMCNTIADIERLRDDNGIPKSKMSPKKVMETKGYCDVVFYDAITFYMVAYIYKDETTINFVDEMTDYLNSIKAIDFVKSFDFDDMSVDTVLDKIGATGFESLTRKEKAFLESQSK
jgi:hypothetical protein